MHEEIEKEVEVAVVVEVEEMKMRAMEYSRGINLYFASNPNFWNLIWRHTGRTLHRYFE